MRNSLVLLCLAAFAGHALAQAPSKAEQAAALDAIREYALSYTRGLPNYTCTQTTRQNVQRETFGRVQSTTTVIEEQLSFVDNREMRKVAKINGYPASPEGPDQLLGALSRGEFGNFLDIVFEPDTDAKLEWNRLATLNRRKVYVFAFRVPQSKGYTLTESRRRIQVPFEGFVYADFETLDYKPAKVAGREFILPAHYFLHFQMVKGFVTNDAEYTAYRRFSADATVKFGNDANKFGNDAQ
jgi:hypothetical protein